MTADKLLRIKEKIQQAKLDAAKTEGELSSLLATLSEEYNCDNPECAIKELTLLEEKISSLNAEIKDKLDAIEDGYEL